MATLSAFTTDHARPKISICYWRTSSGIDISVVGIEDLMIMERAAGRDQDLVDLKRLQRVLERRNSGR